MPKTALLAELLHEHRLLTPEQLKEFDKLCSRGVGLQEVARELVRRGWVTTLQLRWLLRGRGARLWLGGYLLLDRLGKGGMGQVFLARHRLIGRLAAVKVIRGDHHNYPDAVLRFRREILAVSRLDHPNVVHAYDAGVADWALYLALEYIHGPNLAQVVGEGPVPPGLACEYARQAARGLAHMHERGLVHRDVKPSNLALAPHTGLVKVLDVGLARFAEWARPDGPSGMTRAGHLLGTVDYLSPEQVKDPRKAGIRSDVYALGCTLYHLLTGQVPFPDGGAVQKAMQHVLDEAPTVEGLQPDLPSGLGSVVRRMMAKRRRDRYQTMDEAAEALAPFCQPVGPDAHSSMVRPRPPSKSGETLAQIDLAGSSETGSHPTLRG
jgi:serine/threonine-protein kinase